MAAPAPINYSSLAFDQGKPYTTDPTGRKIYMSPGEAAQYVSLFVQDGEQRNEALADKQARFGLTPEAVTNIERYAQQNGVTSQRPTGNIGGGTFMQARKEWNPSSGKYEGGLNQSGILGLIEGLAAVGGPIAASALIPAGGAAGGGAAAAGGAAGSSGAGAAGGGLLSSTSLGSTAGALNVLPAAPVASGAAASGGAAVPWWSSILKDPDTWKMAGDVLGGGADDSAANRSSALASQNELSKQLVQRDRNYYDALIAREQEGRAAEGTALARLRSAQHLLSPGARPVVSPYGVQPRQLTDVEQGANQQISAEMMKRLTAGNPLPVPEKTDLQVDRSLMKPGWLEQLMGYGGAGLSAWGQLRKKK